MLCIPHGLRKNISFHHKNTSSVNTVFDIIEILDTFYLAEDVLLEYIQNWIEYFDKLNSNWLIYIYREYWRNPKQESSQTWLSQRLDSGTHDLWHFWGMRWLWHCVDCGFWVDRGSWEWRENFDKNFTTIRVFKFISQGGMIT